MPKISSSAGRQTVGIIGKVPLSIVPCPLVLLVSLPPSRIVPSGLFVVEPSGLFVVEPPEVSEIEPSGVYPGAPGVAETFSNKTLFSKNRFFKLTSPTLSKNQEAFHSGENWRRTAGSDVRRTTEGVLADFRIGYGGLLVR